MREPSERAGPWRRFSVSSLSGNRHRRARASRKSAISLTVVFLGYSWYADGHPGLAKWQRGYRLRLSVVPRSSANDAGVATCNYPTGRKPGSVRSFTSVALAQLLHRFCRHIVRYAKNMAEGEGFEPPVPLRVQWFSRPPV